MKNIQKFEKFNEAKSEKSEKDLKLKVLIDLKSSDHLGWPEAAEKLKKREAKLLAKYPDYKKEITTYLKHVAEMAKHVTDGDKLDQIHSKMMVIIRALAK